jgi:uncharacterized OsmC-like protein
VRRPPLSSRDPDHPVPETRTGAAIGRRVKVVGEFRPDQVERLVLEELEINGPIANYLTGSLP